MKLVKKALSSARKIKSRRKYRGARGTLSDTFSSFFNAMAMTPEGATGDTGFQRTCTDAIAMLSPDRVLVYGPGPSDFGGASTLQIEAGEPGRIFRAFADTNGKTICLWMGSGISPEDLTTGLPEMSACRAVVLTLSGIQPNDKTSAAIQSTEVLIGAGFEPVLRSAENQDNEFLLLMVHRSALSDIAPELAGKVHAACDPEGESLPVLNWDIPVLIPCFNNQTYCRAMIAQLEAYDFRNITLIDNASTNPEMQAFLDEAESRVTVERLSENLGPRHSVFTPDRLAGLPRYFCVTDPDIRFNTFLPKDFLSQMIAQMKAHDVGKAGFALDISHRQFFKDTVVDLLHQKWTIWEWEERFWGARVGQTPGNDAVYQAVVDTTFAIYDNEVWTKDRFLDAVRMGGRFTAGHVPWYEDSDVPAEERDAYFSESAFSFYKM